MYKNNISRRLWQVFASLLLLVSHSGLCSGTLAVNYWGGIPGRLEYELAVLNAALNAVGAEYTLTNSQRSMGSVRGRNEVATGDFLNVYASGFLRDDHVQQGRLIMIEQPLMKGLLGYRSLLVRKSELEQFRAIRTIDDLRQFTIGQGTGWGDAKVYQFNKVQVDDSGRFHSLLAMLAHERFDAVALGVMEARPTLAQSEYAGQLAVVSELLVYYPHPLVYYVSSHAPELAEALARGMTLIVENGELEQLFNQYFGAQIQQMQRDTRHILILKHPNPPLNGALNNPQFLFGPSFH